MKLVLVNPKLDTGSKLGPLSYDEAFAQCADQIEALNFKSLSGQNILAITRHLKRLAQQLKALVERERTEINSEQTPIQPLQADIRTRVEAQQISEIDPAPLAKGVAAQLAERMMITTNDHREPKMPNVVISNKLSPMAIESGELADFLLTEVQNLTNQPTRQQLIATIEAIKDQTETFPSLSTLVKFLLMPSLEQAEKLNSEHENTLTDEEQTSIALSDYEFYLDSFLKNLEAGLERLGLNENALDSWLDQIGNFMQNRKPEYLADTIEGYDHFKQTKRVLFKELVPELILQTPGCGKDLLTNIKLILQLD